MKILPLKNNILFQFLDETTGAKGRFTDRTLASGIILPTLDSTQKTPRWGQVIAAGPDAQVSTNDYILIEGLMWSYGVEIDGVKYWKTDDTKILVATSVLEETLGTQGTPF